MSRPAFLPVLRRATTAALGLALGATLAASASTPASAGAGFPPCGRSCDFKDPHAYKVRPDAVGDPTSWYVCQDGAITVKSTARVELRYSPRCETTWARNRGSQLYIGWLQIYSTYSNGSARTSTRQSFGNTTAMLDDHRLYNYACLIWFDNEFDYADDVNRHYECTGKY